ncbi:phosphatase PAP2 family protein [bacterium]|nr:MAG: phosphatase PAP2 family protein [bacterium]
MRRYPTVLFFLLFLSIPSIASSQSDTVSLARTAGQDGLTVLHAAGFVFSGPARWDGSDWLKAGGTVALTGAAALLDDEGLSLMDRNRNSLNDRLEKVFVNYGDIGGVLAFAGGFYVTGLLTRHTWLRETGLLVGTSVLLSGTVSTIMKVVGGRARPYMNLGNHYFKPFTLTNEDYISFPSGHTIVAFSTSTVLARQIGNPWATAGLYALATATAVSRTYSRNHWFSDVVCGGIISTLISNSIVSWYERGQETSPLLGLTIEPGPGGISVIFFF